MSVADVMEELDFGPNGGLVYAMEFLTKNMDWLEEELERYGDDDYLILDCPGAWVDCHGRGGAAGPGPGLGRVLRCAPCTQAAVLLHRRRLRLTCVVPLSPRLGTGQIELYTHIPVMPAVVALLQREGFNVCGVYLVRARPAAAPPTDARRGRLRALTCTCGSLRMQLDAMFVSDVSKLLSGTLMALSAMMHLELPHVNVRCGRGGCTAPSVPKRLRG